MEFKVYFEQPTIISCKGNDFNAVFPSHVNRITVEIPEPLCPFCNHTLKNAQCTCRRYTDALKRFKIRHYGTEEVNVRAYEIKVVSSYTFKPEQVEFSKVSATMALSLYPKLLSGQTCTLSLCGTWMLTSASYENGKLKFYYTKKGDNAVYKCQISLPDFKPVQYTDIEIYRMFEKYTFKSRNKYRLGGCVRDFQPKVIATWGYSEFLQKLQRK